MRDAGYSATHQAGKVSFIISRSPLPSLPGSSPVPRLSLIMLSCRLPTPTLGTVERYLAWQLPHFTVPIS
jgi:hypothetical protein